MNLEAKYNMVAIEGRATYERIESYLRDAEPDEAIKQLQNFLKIYPEFAQAHNDLAIYFYKAGNTLKALAHYEKAHKLAPRNITYLKNLADFYMAELDWPEDATQIYLGILKDNPFDVEVLNALGAISRNIGRKKQSILYYERALQLNPSSRDAKQGLQLLGYTDPAPETVVPTERISQMENSRPSAAPNPPPAAVYEKPSSPPPEQMQNPDELYKSAVSRAKEGQSDEAVRILEELIAMSPEHAAAHNDLGVLYQQKGDNASALKHQELAASFSPNNPVYSKNLADLLYIGFSEYEKAMTIYVKELAKTPRDVDILKAVAHICIELGQPDNARHFFERIIAVQPWDKEARDAIKQLSEINTVEETQAPVAERSPGELYSEAQQLVRAEKIAEARTLLEQLIRQRDAYAVAHNDLGVLKYRDGDIQGARNCYERAVKLEPSNGSFRKNLADLYFVELGMSDEAIHIYLELLKEQPRNVETLESLGIISNALGRPEEAKIFFRRALEIEPWKSNIREALKQLK